MSKFGNIIKQAKDGQTGIPENQNAGIDENRNTGIPAKQDDEKGVNLSIKVPENLRRHWSAEAKREGISITAVITEALNNRFGKP